MKNRPGVLRREAGRLAGLFHLRWAPAVLAAIHGGRGARVVTLVHATGAPRDSVRRTLDRLASLGLARRNPGYGHPLRPEWILTPAGERLAPACTALLCRARGAGLEEVGRRKWAFPVLLALLGGPERFAGIESALPGITARALAQTLRAMEGAGALTRRVLDARPPRVVYRVSPSVRPLAPALRALAAAAPAFS